MIKASPLGFLLIMLALGSARAQTPTGTIAGVVTDQTSAALTDARVDIVNRDTGQTRTLTTSVNGVYNAAGLPSGVYQISVEAAGFKRLEREASVEAGTTTTVDVSLELGEITESVTVLRTQPLIRHDHHQVGGLVTRDQIDRIPLNGRNMLELAYLEAGVTRPARLADGRVFVSVLGGGLQTIPRIGSTRVTVDGANISTPGTVGVLLQVSQDVVQEFQISTVNFDPSSSLTTNGAINIVTRSGGNAYHGSGFYFYRDHELAAYPSPEARFQQRHSVLRATSVRISCRGPGAKRSGLLLRELRAHRPDRRDLNPAARRTCAAWRNIPHSVRGKSVQPAWGRAAPS